MRIGTETSEAARGGVVTGDVVCGGLDLDGVLVDSEQLWNVVRRGVAAEASRSWSPGRPERCRA